MADHQRIAFPFFSFSGLDVFCVVHTFVRTTPLSLLLLREVPGSIREISPRGSLKREATFRFSSLP
jgi:hypothetical protein